MLLLIPSLLFLSLGIEATQSVQGRLLTPIASYSKRGAPVEIEIVAPAHHGAAPIVPAGTILHGTVRKARTIGLGIRRERSLLELELNGGCTTPQGNHIACDASLQSVDNAREQVRRQNRITGILAASHPNSWLKGVWFQRPHAHMLQRSTAGLTGPIGAMQKSLAPSPIGAATAVAVRLLLFRMPETEIQLPSGAELNLALHALASASPADPIEIDEDSPLADLPADIRHANGNRAGDQINIAFRGSREQLVDAFDAAGWIAPEPLNRRTFRRMYGAFTTFGNYPAAPVSILYYQDRLPDLVFQKSFNTIAKRHHIRIWQSETDPDLWLGAATQDVGVTFDWSHVSFTHRIDPRIDGERSKVLNDLASSGCVAGETRVPRPAAASNRSDGDLHVVTLSDAGCASPGSTAIARIRLAKPHSAPPVLAARRFVLETRQFATRGNVYYWMYRGAASAISNLRR